MNKPRRQLPLPDDTAPKSRRPAAPLPGGDSGPPPPLPSRGGGGGGGPPLPSRPLPSKPVPPPPSKIPSRNPLDNSGYSFQKELPPKIPSRTAGGRHPGNVPPPYSLTSEDEYTETEMGDDVYAECQDDQFQQEEYDDFNVVNEEEEVQPQQEEYDEFSVQNEEEFEQDEYDEFEVQDNVEDTQESYDEFAMVEEQTYEVGDEIVQDVYEAVEDSGPTAPALPPARHAPRAPLPPPPTQSSPSPPAPPPPAVRRPEKKPAEPPKPKKTAGPAAVQGGLDLNELLSRRNKLKSTSLEETSPPPKNEPKEYLDNLDVKSKMNMFKKKEEEAGLASSTGKKPNFQLKKPELKSPKPDLPKQTSESENLKSLRAGLKPIGSEDRPSLPPRPGDDRLPPPPPPGEEDETSNGKKSPELPPPPPVKDSYSQVQPKNVAPLVNNGNQNDWPDDDDDQDIYDDAITGSDPLNRFNWYFGEIEREKGNTLLKKLSKDGAYLLRKSNRGGSDQPYTLMVLYNSHVYNLKVRLRKDEKFALGEEKPDEITFENVEGLIEHHQNNDVILVQKAGSTQHKTTLRITPD